MLLFVEDEASGQKRRKTVLQRQGHTVLAAMNSEEALDLFAANPVAIVVIDCAMERVNSVELAKRMKQLKPNVKIVMITPHLDFRYDGSNVFDFILARGISLTDLLNLCSYNGSSPKLGS